MATSVAAFPAVAKIAAAWVEITFARAADMVDGRAESTDTLFLMVEAQRVTTLLMTGEMLLGERMVASSVRIGAHTLAKGEGKILVVHQALMVDGTVGGTEITTAPPANVIVCLARCILGCITLMPCSTLSNSESLACPVQEPRASQGTVSVRRLLSSTNTGSMSP